ncbi:diphthine--ammonia ligase [Persicobacter diffluens]|uniref:Diphthamide synthase domain-containing protein n=1 Tax=Persicobacter diffluens TaxID=981 RepID=A0AAN4VZF0_9BACT|nr:hypothetical protein PEDI_34230 [Persicobacter diffluens]
MSKTYINWSGGKDASFALYHFLNENPGGIGKILTTISEEQQRITMHGVRKELLEMQADALNIPLKMVQLPPSEDMDSYNRVMAEAMHELKAEGFEQAIFGDIFLENLKAYRDEKLEASGIKGIYPLWKKDTHALLKEFIALGFKAITVCVNDRLLGEEFIGRIIDQEFLDALPEGVDPCGENGEFHTFVYDGPIFEKPLPIKIGEKKKFTYPKKEGDNWDHTYWFCDLEKA